MRIRPVPRFSWLPWSLAAITGIILAVVSLTSPMILLNPVRAGSVIPAEERITVSGRVLRGDLPVPNAQVYVYQIYGYDPDTRIKRECATQDDGSFQLEMPRPDDEKWKNTTLTAVVQHPKYSLGWTHISKDDTMNVVIKLHQPVTITGAVADGSGNPVQGAEAQIRSISLPKAVISHGNHLWGELIPAPAAKTDSNGNFMVRSLPEGSNVSLDIIGPGYAKETRFGIPAGARELMFKLKPEGRIEGRVTFGETGEPAKDIKLLCQGLYPTMASARVYTDEIGNYDLTNLPAGSYNVGLGVELPGWTAVAREYVRVVEGETVKNVDLKLVKGGFITGRVTDKDTNDPIPDHQIGFHDAARPESQAAVFGARTDESGFYRFRAAPGRALVYTSAPEGYEDVDQVIKYVDVVEGGEVAGVDFQFQKGITLTGTVLTFEGEPVAGAAITDRLEWVEQYGKSDKEGGFTITGLRPGQKFSVKAEQKELQLRGYADLEAQPDAEVEILVERYETTSVSGRVVNQQWQPVPSANVSLIRWDKEMRRGIGTSVGMTDASGEYRIPRLIVGDEYVVSAEAEGHREGRTEMFTPASDMPPLPDIMLPPIGRFFLEGKVTDTDGNPVVGARVRSQSGESQAMTDENGRYLLDDLLFAVEVEVTINHPDYGHSRFRYVATNRTQDQDFVIVKAERYLAGKVVDIHGNPIEGANVWVESSADEVSGHVNVAYSTNSQGEFRLENVVNEIESITVSSNRLKLSKIFENVETNRDDVVFVLEESSEPPKPPTAEETAKGEYRSKARQREKELPGKPAPELDVAQWLRGEPATLAELKGKVIVLHFWASRLVENVEAIRLLNALQKEYGPKGLVCIGIHEFTTQVDELKKLIEEKGAAYRIAVDKESSVAGAKGVTFDKYAVAWFPSTILIDRDGVLQGRVWDRELEEKIQELLSD